jgi:hypothetical protein
MAIGALLSTVAYYVLLQACRHMGFTALQLQHSMNCASVLFYLPLTLPVDGTAWGAQFAGWSAADWAALLGLSTVAYMGSGVFMQVGHTLLLRAHPPAPLAAGAAEAPAARLCHPAGRPCSLPAP